MCILKIKCGEMFCTNPLSKENVIKHVDVWSNGTELVGFK